MFKGYWNLPDKTAATFTDDGWLKTGDVGVWVDGTHVKIVDRIKDIIITSGGKNISPSEIENKLKTSPYVKEAMVIGDRRNYLTALIGIELDTVGDWAQRRGIPYTTYRDLSEKPEVLELIQKVVDDTNEQFARVETIRQFRMIPKELDHEDGELTATQKLKRSAMEGMFSDLIDRNVRPTNVGRGVDLACDRGPDRATGGTRQVPQRPAQRRRPGRGVCAAGSGLRDHLQGDPGDQLRSRIPGRNRRLSHSFVLHRSSIFRGACCQSCRRWARWSLSALCAVFAAAVVGLLVERIFIRPMVGEPLFSVAIITVGADIILRTINDDFVGQGVRSLADPWGIQFIQVGNININQTQIVTVVVSLSVLRARCLVPSEPAGCGDASDGLRPGGCPGPRDQRRPHLRDCLGDRGRFGGGGRNLLVGIAAGRRYHQRHRVCGVPGLSRHHHRRARLGGGSGGGGFLVGIAEIVIGTYTAGYLQHRRGRLRDDRALPADADLPAVPPVRPLRHRRRSEEYEQVVSGTWYV